MRPAHEPQQRRGQQQEDEGEADPGEGVAATFEDVRELSAGCRFRDCTHQGEPGCAVERAVAEGRLAADRLASYHKLQRELKHLQVQHDARAQLDQKRRWRAIHRAARHHKPRE